MPNGMIEIEEFEKVADNDVKLNILFKTLVCHIDKIDKRFEVGNEKFKKLESRRLTDKIWSGVGGVIGGFLASLGMKWGS